MKIGKKKWYDKYPTDITIGEKSFTCHNCGTVVVAEIGKEKDFIDSHKCKR